MVIPWYKQGIGSKTLEDTKICLCSNPLYRMAQYSRPSVSTDVEPAYMEGQLYLLIYYCAFTSFSTLILQVLLPIFQFLSITKVYNAFYILL